MVVVGFVLSLLRLEIQILGSLDAKPAGALAVKTTWAPFNDPSFPTDFQ